LISISLRQRSRAETQIATQIAIVLKSFFAIVFLSPDYGNFV
jgi:hypothetical protein